MKTLLTFVAATVFAVSTAFAQQPIPGFAGVVSAPTGQQGTDLGANLTSGAAGIDLANRVKLRGYIDFKYENVDDEGNGHDKGFKTWADLDFLLDFSPVTAEIHTRINGKAGELLEQAFMRYNFNRDFSLSMGRQLTTLGFEADEAPNRYQVSNAYLFGDSIISAGNTTGGNSLRRNYVDGIRANFNNGRFGFTLGLHNELFATDNSTKNGDVGVDLQAAFMILPGFEARLGYAHDSTPAGGDDDIEQFNAWLSYNEGGLTLAFEYDDWDILGQDAWDIMLLGNYQFNNLIALTLRYSHEDFDNVLDNDRITLGLGFTITDNFGINLELSHAGVDLESGGDYDVDEFYAESILTF